MEAMNHDQHSRGFLPTPLARIGLIIPSSNRLTEPQLRHFAPPELGIHVTRLQMTGKWNRPLSALGDDIQRASRRARRCEGATSSCSIAPATRWRRGRTAMLGRAS